MAPAEACGLVLSSVHGTGSAADDAALPALAALVDEYAPLLFRVAHSVLRSEADAEDVVQDAFVRVIEHRSTLPAVRDMRVWLVRIAWNLALDRKRRIRPEQMDDVFVQSLVSRELPADEGPPFGKPIRAEVEEPLPVLGTELPWEAVDSATELPIQVTDWARRVKVIATGTAFSAVPLVLI